MNNPEMYQKYISYQKIDATHCLEKLKTKIQWNKSPSVIDLGSGDGLVTNTVLKPFLPADFKELIGADISEVNKEFATKKYGDVKTKFVVLDAVEDIPESFEGAFDFVFSSYLFHFLHDQEKAFKNVYDLLKKGSHCALVWSGSISFYDVFIAMSKTKKWNSSMKNIDTFVPRYHHMTKKETEDEIKRISKAIGYKNVDVVCEEVEYVYENLSYFFKMMESANCFKIPADNLSDFMKDFADLVETLNALEKMDSGRIKIRYNRIEFFGQK